jgi:16S rRNA (adenine1518-N6/adenine1519-N6)-dimethyltransferase
MLRKPYNIFFNGNIEVAKKLKINLNLRPQNLNFDIYYKLVEEFERL